MSMSPDLPTKAARSELLLSFLGSELSVSIP